MDLDDIGFKHIILVMVLSFIALTFYLIAFTGHPSDGGGKVIDAKVSNKIPSNGSENQSREPPIKNEVVIVYHNITKYLNVTINKTVYFNKTIEYKLNISEIQRDLILNIKPDVCHTIGCSDGFDKAKREVLDILEWQKPKFREAWKTGFQDLYRPKPQNESQAVFLIEQRHYGNYVVVDNYYWRLTNDYNETVFNMIDERLNITEFNSTNDTRNFIYNVMFNSSLFDNQSYILRKIR